MPALSAVPAAPAAGPAARALRAALVGTVVSLCASAAHALAGGAVTAGPVAATGVVGAVVAWSLAGRRLAGPQLLGLLLLGQVVLHVLAPSTPHGGAAMVVAHVAATLVCLLVVRDGEAVLWRVVDLLVPSVRTGGPVPVPVATVHPGEPLVVVPRTRPARVRDRAPPAGR